MEEQTQTDLVLAAEQHHPLDSVAGAELEHSTVGTAAEDVSDRKGVGYHPAAVAPPVQARVVVGLVQMAESVSVAQVAESVAAVPIADSVAGVRAVELAGLVQVVAEPAEIDYFVEFAGKHQAQAVESD